MKRQLPRVFSSFRSSKRRIAPTFSARGAQVTVVRGEEFPIAVNDTVEMARVGSPPPAAWRDLFEQSDGNHTLCLQNDDDDDYEYYDKEDDNFDGTNSPPPPPPPETEAATLFRLRICDSQTAGDSVFVAHTTSDKIATPCAIDVPSAAPFGAKAHAPIAATASLTSTTDSCDASDGSVISGGTTPIHAVPSTSVGHAKLHYILEELLNTEESYVNELESLVEFYVLPFEAAAYSVFIPPALRGQSDVIFGNIKDLAEYHRRVLLPELQRCGGSVSEICRVLIRQRNNFLTLYRPYCQNKPQSEALRGANENASGDGFGEHCKFFIECQRRAGHPLPLGAYLLKPIQRITKYQLLLRELSRCYADTQRRDVDAALAAMLELLGQLNADMQQLHILGFAGDLRLFGPLRLQTECEVYSFKRKSRRLANKPQRRHIFLFDGGVLFCKRRDQQIQYASEYYEHKLCIPIHNLGFAECSKWSPDRFELWDESRNDGYAVRVADEDEKLRAKWITRLARLTTLYAQQQRCARESRDGDAHAVTVVANGKAAVDFCATINEGTTFHQRRHSSYLSGAATTNTAQQQWQYQQQQLQLQHEQQKQQYGQQSLNVNSNSIDDGTTPHRNHRPQSWTSDGSCSMSSRSSVSAFDDAAHAADSFGMSDVHGEPSLTAPPSCQSSFARRRLSALIQVHAVVDTAHEAAAADTENDAPKSPPLSGTHVTSIHIPASKSLQNAAASADTNETMFGRHAASFHQLGSIAERRRQANGKAAKLIGLSSHFLNNNKVEVGGE